MSTELGTFKREQLDALACYVWIDATTIVGQTGTKDSDERNLAGLPLVFNQNVCYEWPMNQENQYRRWQELIELTEIFGDAIVLPAGSPSDRPVAEELCGISAAGTGKERVDSHCEHHKSRDSEHAA